MLCDLKISILLVCGVSLIYAEFDIEQLLGDITKITEVDYNLPSTIVPTFYELSIKINFEKIISYEGEISINFRVKLKTNQVTLHSHELNITSISILNDVSKLRLHNHTVLETSQMLVINTKPSLTEDHVYTVRISFRNTLKEGDSGLFLESFMIENKTQWIAATQFEPIFARSVFPCFDEPHFTTPFLLHVARRNEQDTLCNLPLIRSEIDPENKNITWDTFGTQKPIPTYSLKFMVSDFTLLKLTQNHKLRPDVKHVPLASYSHRVLSKKMKQIMNCIQLFTQVEMKENSNDFEIYLIPNSADFVLDDWEMKLFGKTAFYYPKKDPLQNKESMALNMARQYAREMITERLAHKRWEYAWWNEALISYMAYRVATEVESYYKLTEYYLIDVFQKSLITDVYGFSISSLNNKPSAIIENYENIAVHRGVAILNMLEHTITPKVFQKAFSEYLKICNNNASRTPHEFYQIIDTEVDGKRNHYPTTISQFMKSWTELSEYPLILINTTKGNVDITQEIYGTENNFDGVQWIIPLTYTTKTIHDFYDVTPKVWLFPHQEIKMGQMLERGDWILCNIQAIGYYRVNYDYDNWKELIQQLYSDPEAIDIINRAQLVDDILHLAIDERVDFHLALTLTNYLKNEYNLLPWFSAVNVFKNLILTYDQTSASIALRNYILDLFQNIYQTVGFYGSRRDSYEVKISRPEFVYLACNLKLSDCVEKSLEEFNNNVNDLTKINVDIREAVFCTAAKHYNQTEVWIRLWSMYESPIYDYEKSIIIRSFKCFEETKVLKHILYKINDHEENSLTHKHKEEAYKSVFLSKGGTKACLQYLEEILSESNAVYSTNTVATINYIISNMIIGNHEQLKFIQNLLAQITDLNQTDYQGLLHALKSKYRESKESLSYIENVVREINSAISRISPSSPPLIKKKSFKNLAENYVRKELDRFSYKHVVKNVFYDYLGPRIFGKYFRYISYLNFSRRQFPMINSSLVYSRKSTFRISFSGRAKHQLQNRIMTTHHKVNWREISNTCKIIKQIERVSPNLVWNVLCTMFCLSFIIIFLFVLHLLQNYFLNAFTQLISVVKSNDFRNNFHPKTTSIIYKCTLFSF